LGTRAPDRAPLGDPTEVYSARAAVNPEPPLKAAAAPFVPIDLPNPFRAGDEVRLRTPPVDPATALGTAPSPRP
ncbi:MAG TPA: hypothetical protein VIL46_13150, partial [Gemmataceae bacterium]